MFEHLASSRSHGECEIFRGWRIVSLSLEVFTAQSHFLLTLGFWTVVQCDKLPLLLRPWLPVMTDCIPLELQARRNYSPCVAFVGVFLSQQQKKQLR